MIRVVRHRHRVVAVGASVCGDSNHGLGTVHHEQNCP